MSEIPEIGSLNVICPNDGNRFPEGRNCPQCGYPRLPTSPPPLPIQVDRFAILQPRINTYNEEYSRLHLRLQSYYENIEAFNSEFARYIELELKLLKNMEQELKLKEQSLADKAREDYASRIDERRAELDKRLFENVSRYEDGSVTGLFLSARIDDLRQHLSNWISEVENLCLKIGQSQQKKQGRNKRTQQPKISESIIGALSRKYEGKVESVSSGKGDKGGKSYGAYQMTSKGKGGGTVAQFIKTAGTQWLEEFKDLKPGSIGFDEKWKEIAARDPEGFWKAQHDFIKSNYYDPFVKKLKSINLEAESRSLALQNVIWSTIVQHGRYTDIVQDALKGRDPRELSDEVLIKLIYAERSRTSAKGTMIHFRGNSKKVQKGVAKRLKREEADAFRLLKRK